VWFRELQAAKNTRAYAADWVAYQYEDWKSMNPLALGLVVIGALLFGLGLLIAVKRQTATGTVISLLGIAIAAVPVVVSWLLS
jgi:hypothetical protein